MYKLRAYPSSLIITNSKCLFELCSFLLNFSIEVAADCLLCPRLVKEFRPPFFLWVTNNISHSLEHRNQNMVLNPINLGKKLRLSGKTNQTITLRSLVCDISHLFMNCWGSFAKLRKNSRFVFRVLMDSTVSCILLSKFWKKILHMFRDEKVRN